VINFRSFREAYFSDLKSFESINVCQFAIFLTGTACVPLWWLILNQLMAFDVATIIFANGVLLFTVVAEILLIIFLCHVVKKFKSKKIMLLMMISVVCFVAANIFCFALSTLDIRLRYSLILSILIALVIFVIYLRNEGKKFLFTFAIALIVISACFATLDFMSRSHEVKQFYDFDQGNKKNLYILVFDSLISSNAYKDIYQQQVSPWESYLDEKGFRVIGNAVAAGDNTLVSFGAVFGFGINSRKIQMTGQNNPVMRHFKLDGYHNSLYTESSYFGTVRGGSLDYLYPHSLVPMGCSFSPKYFLFNACHLLQFSSTVVSSTSNMVADFKKQLELRVKSDKNLTVVYTWYPGHSPREADYLYDGGKLTQKWKSKFISKAGKSVPIIDSLVGAIMKNDPNPVIVLFGDHGSWNYRGVADSGNSSLTPDLIKEDKYGVTFAVFPKNTCEPIFVENYQIKNLIKDVLNCGALK